MLQIEIYDNDLKIVRKRVPNSILLGLPPYSVKPPSSWSDNSKASMQPLINVIHWGSFLVSSTWAEGSLFWPKQKEHQYSISLLLLLLLNGRSCSNNIQNQSVGYHTDGTKHHVLAAISLHLYVPPLQKL